MIITANDKKLLRAQIMADSKTISDSRLKNFNKTF